jgi:two-component system, NarL family, response regulator DevR
MTTPLAQRGHDHDRRILVVDADHRVRDSFAGLIALVDGVEVVGTTGQPPEAMAALRGSRPDIVVIDPRLPELEVGLALVGAMHRARPDVRVVVLGWSGDHEQLAMDAGADGFICKSADPVAVVEAVLAVALAPALEAYPAAHPALRPEVVGS